GYNYRMTNVQAAIGLGQLERYTEIYQNKQRVYNFYQTFLKTEVKRQGVFDKAQHGLWMNAIWVNDPLTLADVLRANGIDTRPSFYPLHLMPPYYDNKEYPNSVEVFKHTLVLPSSPTLTNDQLSFICNIVNKWA